MRRWHNHLGSGHFCRRRSSGYFRRHRDFGFEINDGLGSPDGCQWPHRSGNGRWAWRGGGRSRGLGRFWPTLFDHQHQNIALFWLDATELVFYIPALGLAKIDQIFAVHIQLTSD